MIKFIENVLIEVTFHAHADAIWFEITSRSRGMCVYMYVHMYVCVVDFSWTIKQHCALVKL